MPLETATLSDGKKLQYEKTSDAPKGAMKTTYFTPDRTQVVQLYNETNAAKDPQRKNRVQAIVGKYSPLNDPATAAYFRNLFCWPSAMVVAPQLGVVCPAFSHNFFFAAGPFKGREKKSTWFTSSRTRRYLPPSETGSLMEMFRIAIQVARGVRRLHMAGLAHSDLSPNNVLIDPVNGKAVIIDLDSLVVPQIYPPDVDGTPKYVAPEVVATQSLPLGHPQRKQPSVRTDQHALAVLIYEYLLLRHPLEGIRTFPGKEPDEEDALLFGSQALFIEHPMDHRNRPPDLRTDYRVFGTELQELFDQAFVRALQQPEQRPAAYQWERALLRAYELFTPCPNVNCPQKWFIVREGKRMICPFCSKEAPGRVPVMKLQSRLGTGEWQEDGRIALLDGARLYPWHLQVGGLPNESSDRTPQAFSRRNGNQWLLHNIGLPNMRNAQGAVVGVGASVPLNDGTSLLLSPERRGLVNMAGR